MAPNTRTAWRAAALALAVVAGLAVLPRIAHALSVTYLEPDFGTGDFVPTTVADGGPGDLDGTLNGQIQFDFGVEADPFFSQLQGVLSTTIAPSPTLSQLYSSVGTVLTLTSFTATSSSSVNTSFPHRLLIAADTPSHFANQTCYAADGSVSNGSGTLSGSTYRFLHGVGQATTLNVAETFGFAFEGTASGPSPVTFTQSVVNGCGYPGLPPVSGTELVGLLELAAGDGDSLQLPSSWQVATGTLAAPEPALLPVLGLGLLALRRR